MESSLPAGFRTKNISLNVGVLIKQVLGLGFRVDYMLGPQSPHIGGTLRPKYSPFRHMDPEGKSKPETPRAPNAFSEFTSGKCGLGLRVKG